MNSSLDARGPTGGIDLVFFLSFFLSFFFFGFFSGLVVWRWVVVDLKLREIDRMR